MYRQNPSHQGMPKDLLTRIEWDRLARRGKLGRL